MSRLIIKNDAGKVILDVPNVPNTTSTVRLLTTGRQTQTTVRYERRPA